MSKIQLLIELDEKDYEELNTFYILNLGTEEYRKIIEKHCTGAIRHGKPLPKEHGRLIDINSIESIMLEDSSNRLVHIKGDAVGWFIEAPTIIDAEE